MAARGFPAQNNASDIRGQNSFGEPGTNDRPSMETPGEGSSCHTQREVSSHTPHSDGLSSQDPALAGVAAAAARFLQESSADGETFQERCASSTVNKQSSASQPLPSTGNRSGAPQALTSAPQGNDALIQTRQSASQPCHSTTSTYPVNNHNHEENIHSDTNNDHRRQAQSLLDAARNAAENMQYIENAVDDLTYHSQIADTYEKVVTWQRNLFNIPFGQVGGSFVDELAKTIGRFAEAEPLPFRRVAWKAVGVACHLLLQRPVGVGSSSLVVWHVWRFLIKCNDWRRRRRVDQNERSFLSFFFHF